MAITAQEIMSPESARQIATRWVIGPVAELPPMSKEDRRMADEAAARFLEAVEHYLEQQP
jgi:hypothetical protein